MNFYQSVFLQKNFFKNIHEKLGFGVFTLYYLPFLIRAMTRKIIFKNLDYLCHKSVKLQKKSKNILNFGNIFTVTMIKPP